LARRLELRAPDLLRVMLHPPRPRKVLRELALPNPDCFAVLTEDDRARAGCSLVQREKVAVSHQRTADHYTHSMSTRTVNSTLVALVLAQWLSGAGTFLVGTPSGRWVVWLHAAGGAAICVLLAWKGRVILRSLGRHGLGLWAAPSLTLLALLLAVLLTGVLW